MGSVVFNILHKSKISLKFHPKFGSGSGSNFDQLFWFKKLPMLIKYSNFLESSETL